MKTFCAYILAILGAGVLSFTPMASFAQSEQTDVKTVEFGGGTWTVVGSVAEFSSYLGQDALHINQGRIWLDDAGFSDGVIEFDVAYTGSRGFIGLGFRTNTGRDNFEEFYFRAHRSGFRDTIQYTPIEHGSAAWQILTDSNAVISAYEEFEKWNHVKLVVKGDKADLYFNSDAPIAHIADLKTARNKGGIMLRANVGFGMKKSGYFANFSHRPLKRGDKIIGKSAVDVTMPAGVIGKWNISSYVKEKDVQAMTLSSDLTRAQIWQILGVETNGIANLSKLAKRDRVNNTVLVKTTIRSDTAKTIPFKFGYSDRVRLFVNGKFVYGANAGFRSRDERFYGTVGLFDTVGLNLKAGENTIIAAVSENFGGWAFTGAIEDQTGLIITPYHLIIH